MNVADELRFRLWCATEHYSDIYRGRIGALRVLEYESKHCPVDVTRPAREKRMQKAPFVRTRSKSGPISTYSEAAAAGL